jgi:hypothetical protein
MFRNSIAPLALSGLLVVSLPVFSQEAVVPPDQTAVPATTSTPDESQAPEAAAPAEGDGATMMPGMMGRGMMGQGRKSCHKGMGGMMGMMSGPMSKGGMNAMGPGARDMDGMQGCRADRAGISKKQYRELMGRLDILDARMAKIDAMLERLLQR